MFGGNTSNVLSVNDLEMGEFIGVYRSGSARRASLPKGNAGVLKLADISKNPELEDELSQEALIYDRLQDLQGKSIPNLLGHGRFSEQFLVGLLTSDEGVDTSQIEPDRSFVKKARTVLEQIHLKGVLHGDVRKENILRNTKGDPVFIDFGLSKLVPANTPEWLQQTQAEVAEFDLLF